MIWMICAATVPAIIIGVPLKLRFDHLLESPLLAGCLLIATGLMLLGTKRWIGKPHAGELDYKKALLIGTSQAAAILPGLSRSGATISTGLALGLSPKLAATFSFLMAIPAIAGGGAQPVPRLPYAPQADRQHRLQHGHFGLRVDHRSPPTSQWPSTSAG